MVMGRVYQEEREVTYLLVMLAVVTWAWLMLHPALKSKTTMTTEKALLFISEPPSRTRLADMI